MKTGKMLTKVEAAERMGLSLRQLDRLMMQREIPFYKFGDTKRASIRIAEADIDKYVARFRNEAQSA